MDGSLFQRKHRRPTMATTIEKLPDHLLSNILIRVPARTLAQMRSVSKPLNALLSQPSFIQSHLHRSIKTNHEILLLFKHFRSNEVTAYPSRTPHLELPNFVQLPIYADPNDSYIGHELIGAVNGLICFRYVTDIGCFIQIWNPSISALFELPELALLGELRIKFRFGFDPFNDDYKIVRISERIDVELLVYSSIFREDKVCGDGHDGRLHWLFFVGDDQDLERIVAFDLGAETFSQIRLPVVVNNMDHNNVLGVLGGKLCLMSCLKDHNCEVWLMNEYGNAESWAKHHVFSQFSANDMRPFGFTLRNEFLFASFEVLSIYDPIAAKVKSFMLKVEGDAKIVPYVDSLVWLTP
ncbi:hypothetical protein OSB04_017970 [Centaurea solstitialis]|uniref:F-box domain-containing protein n=1 Tax=Centaurea solstitialis TaxID=347529 RepID=A0AA38WIV5_9ASTR|nr:hypothetical protein OSB04_017970 [Centaurea solstitialis]